MPVIVVVTKADKLSRTAAATRLGEIARTLGLDEEQMILHSSETGAGRNELAAAVVSVLDQPPWSRP